MQWIPPKMPRQAIDLGLRIHETPSVAKTVP
jgi:hypothetical protein